MLLTCRCRYELIASFVLVTAWRLANWGSFWDQTPLQALHNIERKHFESPHPGAGMASYHHDSRSPLRSPLLPQDKRILPRPWRTIQFGACRNQKKKISQITRARQWCDLATNCQLVPCINQVHEFSAAPFIVRLSAIIDCLTGLDGFEQKANGTGNTHRQGRRWMVSTHALTPCERHTPDICPFVPHFVCGHKSTRTEKLHKKKTLTVATESVINGSHH